MTVYLSVLVLLVGMVGFKIAKDADWKELCRIAFFAGLLAFLLQVRPESFRLLP